MLAKLRLNTLLEDTAVDYTDAVLLTELNDSLTTKFQQLVLDADSGYWLQTTTVNTTTGQAMYRIPPRSIGLSKVEIVGVNAANASYCRLPRTTEGHSDMFQTTVGGVGTPQCFVTRGDQIVLLPTPDNSGYTLRISYYIRPSKLTASQNSVSGTDRGRVLSINTSTRVALLNTAPFDMSLTVPAAITTGFQRVDVVHPNGWQELSLVQSTQTIAGGISITFGGTDDLSEIQVGDYVRAEDQTDWPPIPVDFHRCLVDVASVKILIQQDNQRKAAGIASDVNADIGRFSTLISQRVKEEPVTVRANLPFLRRGWG
jgi:hypothetical protein